MIAVSLLNSSPPQRYLELLKQFRLIDDTFFEVCLDGSDECMQLLLRIFFKRDDIIVKEVVFYSDPAKMHYPELAKRVDFFKHDQKGVQVMCEIMEKFGNELLAEGRAEGLDEGRTQTALDMLRDNRPMEEIIKYSHLPESRIKELAVQLQ